MAEALLTVLSQADSYEEHAPTAALLLVVLYWLLDVL